MGIARKLVPATVILTLLGTPALAQADPIHVSANATFPTATPGGFQEVGCQVENLSGQTIMVLFTTFVTYADGSVQSFRINQPPTVIGPDETFILFIAFAVPQDAALGTATFTCAARVVGPVGAGFAQTATATFEVVSG